MPQRIQKLKYLLTGGLLLWVMIDAGSFLNLSYNYCLNQDAPLEVEAMRHCGIDMDQYTDLSDSLLAGRGYSARAITNMYGLIGNVGEYVPETNRAPGYPVLLAGLRSLNPARRTLLYFNWLCFIVIFIASAVFARHFLGNIPALVIALWLINNDQIRKWTLGGSSDIVCTAAVALFLVALFWPRESRWSLLIVGVTAIAGSFMRSNSFLIFVTLLCVSLWTERRPKLAAPLAILILSLAAWCWRNHTLSGRFTLSTMSGNQLMLQYPISDPDSPEAQWNLWYSTPTFESIRGYKNGENINRTWAQVDNESAALAKQWIINHPTSTLRVFQSGWDKLFSFTTEGWLKTPLELLANPLRSLSNALWLTLCLVLGALGLNSLDRHHQATNRIAFSLASSSLVFLLISNFWHGDWIGVRGIMEALPLIFPLYFYGLFALAMIARRLTPSDPFFARQS